MKDKKKRIKIGNFVIKDMKKFLTLILILILIVILICILISNIVNSSSDEKTLSSLDAKRNVKELSSKYESSEMKQVFLDDYNKIQSSVGLYIMNNVTTDSNSFNLVVNEINTILKSNNWEKLSITKNDTWNGTFSLDKEGVLKFKFSLKAIEPTWVNDSDIKNKLYLN